MPVNGGPGARAGIVVTGTEVLTGRVSDRNGPWLAERLQELGVQLAYTTIVGDRPQDMREALSFMTAHELDLVITSGGLGPTADDLTAEVVGSFQEREMRLDPAVEERIAEILRPLAKRFPHVDMEAVRAGNRKQAMVPEGATVLDPVGTAPGLVVPPPASREHPTIVVLPGPPRELQPMWGTAVATEALKAALSGARRVEQRMLRLFGIPESEIAETLRVAEREGVALGRLEITTCLKRAEVEVVSVFDPADEGVYVEFEDVVARRHPDTLFSNDGTSVDVQVAALLRGGAAIGAQTVATAESCTGGLLAARLTELPGSSDYFRGSIVAYDNDVKVAAAGVDPALIEAHGAVSCEVAVALAEGACDRLGADVGIGVTGIAGPGGGTEEKPVGLVWLSVARPRRDRAGAGERLTRKVELPGGRADVRDRATTVAMHLLRRLLRGEAAGAG
ncbi:MAG TPA: competence/damage-inducible protein A [Solirubrobacteraceae bacterium]|nr:competence/damage-inducible protein A [Solirubrobacteraceae bacterium]